MFWGEEDDEVINVGLPEKLKKAFNSKYDTYLKLVNEFNLKLESVGHQFE